MKYAGFESVGRPGGGEQLLAVVFDWRYLVHVLSIEIRAPIPTSTCQSPGVVSSPPPDHLNSTARVPGWRFSTPDIFDSTDGQLGLEPLVQQCFGLFPIALYCAFRDAAE